MPKVRQLPPGQSRSSWGKVLVLLGIFLVLLYLYVNLTQPPMPAGGMESAGIKSVFTIYGWDRDRLESPNSVAVGPQGGIYVSDTGNHRIVVFDSDGEFRFAIGGKAATPQDQPKKGPLLFPLGLAVSSTGDIYVASMERSMVLVFNRQGRLKREISIEKPIDVTINGDELVVSTPGTIQTLTLSGAKKSEWGRQGRRLGSFQYPNGLGHDVDGNLFVSDTQNARIQILNPRGKVIGAAGEPPKDLNDAGRMFGLNMGLTVDEEQRIFIVDAFRHSIHVFDHDGNKLAEFGRQGELEGRFNYPSGLAYLGRGKFAVADKWNDRVQIVRLDLPNEIEVEERAQLVYPYILLVFLIALLIFLSWRRRRLEKADTQGHFAQRARLK